MRTYAANIYIINGTDRDLAFTNFSCDANDWEIPPQFPNVVAPSTQQFVRAEAIRDRSNVPFSVNVGINGETLEISKYDPYHDAWTVTPRNSQGMRITMVVGPSVGTGPYDVLILVAGTKYNP